MATYTLAYNKYFQEIVKNVTFLHPHMKWSPFATLYIILFIVFTALITMYYVVFICLLSVSPTRK